MNTPSNKTAKRNFKDSKNVLKYLCMPIRLPPVQVEMEQSNRWTSQLVQSHCHGRESAFQDAHFACAAWYLHRWNCSQDTARRVPFGRRLVLCSLHMHSLWFHSLARSTSVVCSIRLFHCRSSSSDSTTISRFTQVGLHSWCKIKADKIYIFREAEQVTANGPSAAHKCSPPHHPTTVPHPSARRMADASWSFWRGRDVPVLKKKNRCIQS